MTKRLGFLALEVTGLCKSYRLGEKKLPVLSNLNLSVDKGEMVVIMGPSGTGKTTLLNCISGIDAPDLGSIRIDGQLIDFSSEKALAQLRRQQLSIVFQFFNLIPTLTVRENIVLPFYISNKFDSVAVKQTDEIINNLGLQERESHYPHQLSGGEMQLVSIARALVTSPSLLLADEPTGNVNPNIGRSILDALKKTAKQKNTGILMVTHSPEHASWADRVCFLKEGSIQAEHIQNGEILNMSGIYQCLLDLEI